MMLYASRIAERPAKVHDPCRVNRTRLPFRSLPQDIGPDHLRELGYQDRKQLHNFKYFTWVEQQQRSADELRKLWDEEFWEETFAQVARWDRMIEEFNGRDANRGRVSGNRKQS